MTAMIEEPVVLVIEDETEFRKPAHEQARRLNRKEVLAANRAASEVDAETLAAFLDLLYAADADYIDAEPPAMPAPLLDWDEVGLALAESQAMLKNMQALLSVTLEEMGVEEHAEIRIYEDTEGMLRLVVDHPRRDEIEDAINSPRNRQLQELYRSATTGMSLAGSLVGNGALPAEVLEMVKNAATVA